MFVKTVLIMILSIIPFVAKAQNPAAKKHMVDIVQWETSAGAKVFFVQTPELPMLDVRVVFDAGSSQDGGHAGIAQMTAGLLATGAGKLSADDIAERLDRVGALYGAGAARDATTVSLRTLTKPETMDAALAVLEKILKAPSFPADQFALRQNQVLQAIADRDQQPDRIVAKTFFKSLYQSTPYGHPVIGEKASITAIKRRDVQCFYQRFYRASNEKIVLVGDISRQQAEAIAERLIIPTNKQINDTKAQVSQAAPSEEKRPVDQHVDFPAEQITALMGQMGIDRHDPDYFALILGNHILGGGALTSRLFHNVRDEKGLAYSVYSFFYPLRNRGPFLIALQTRSEKADQALSIARKTLDQFVYEAPTQKEMSMAKNAVTGQFLLGLASNAAIADAVADIATYELPLDYLDQFTHAIQSLTRQQVHAAFKRHVDPKSIFTVTVGRSHQ